MRRIIAIFTIISLCLCCWLNTTALARESYYMPGYGSKLEDENWYVFAKLTKDVATEGADLVIVVAYDENGTIVSVKSQNIEPDLGRSAAAEFYFPVQKPSISTFKFLVWEDYNTMIPLVTSKELKAGSSVSGGRDGGGGNGGSGSGGGTIIGN